jgi:hypothetical protein
LFGLAVVLFDSNKMDGSSKVCRQRCAKVKDWIHGIAALGALF